MSMKRILIAAMAAPALLLGGCEVGTKYVDQTGPRGAGMDQVVAKSHVVKASAIPDAPYALTADMLNGPRASATYQNVKVLGDTSTEEFNRLMAEITTWVAPAEQGCNYCHNPENMASDEKYTKVVARRMLQMTRAINTDYKSHVQGVGVTCWTCHRGNQIPEYRWSMGPVESASILGNKHGQNTPDKNVGYASLPYDPFTSYLQGKNVIRVAGNSPYPTPDKGVSIKNAEQSYGLMMHLSQSLGVNCTFCHNTQSFRNWGESRPQRVTAWYGIRMVRDVNDEYISSLHGVFPKDQAGPLGDPYKVNCATCHQGQSKPLGGKSMLGDNPTLAGGNKPVMAAAPSTAPAASGEAGAPGPVLEAAKDAQTPVPAR